MCRVCVTLSNINSPHFSTPVFLYNVLQPIKVVNIFMVVTFSRMFFFVK